MEHSFVYGENAQWCLEDSQVSHLRSELFNLWLIKDYFFRNIRKTKLMRLSLQQAYSSSRMDESKMHSYFTLQLFKTLSQVNLSTALVQLFEELALCYFLYWMSATHITKAATTLRRLVSPFCSHSKECSSSQSVFLPEPILVKLILCFNAVVFRIVSKSGNKWESTSLQQIFLQRLLAFGLVEEPNYGYWTIHG